MPEPRVRLRRVYDPADPSGDGFRVLVDRVWPRGVRREELAVDAWLREVAPSDELRRWFGHRQERWDEFRRRYRSELQAPERRQVLDELEHRARQGPLTLLFGARDAERNQAAVIGEVLEERLKS